MASRKETKWVNLAAWGGESLAAAIGRRKLDCSYWTLDLLDLMDELDLMDSLLDNRVIVVFC